MGLLILFIFGFSFVAGHPIDPKDLQSGNIAVALVALAFIVTGVLSVALCLCCKKRQDGFKEFTNPRSSNVGFTNTLATEVAIFPPPGALSQRQEMTLIPPVANIPSKPPGCSVATPNISDWFADENGNFPRQLISYKKEMGTGWFGKVMEGETRGTKVAVRILKEGSTTEEKSYFLNEAKPFRDLNHKNVAKLYGRCLEQEPYLLIFELVNNRDLKNFLTVNSNSKAAMFEQGICLKLMTDVSEGLDFMNKNGFIHSDLAARNCLVGGDLTVRIGDYGTSVDSYKNEYYHIGGIAVPIRWCAPETVSFTSSSIETKEVTVSANVWSLGVILWEIAEFARLPFDDLSDEEVISKVFGQEKLRLPQPDCPSGQYLHNIMQICWRLENRATAEQVISMLQYLKMNPFQESDFESRWKKLKPNTVAVVDNHTPIHSPRHTELAQRLKLQTKTEFDSGVDLEIKPDDSFKTSSPTTSLSVMSDDFLQKKSPSLTNLKGSLEDVQYDSWLQGVEQKTDEDRTFVKNISEAIKNLDETLALEKTSSSSPDSSIECPKKPLEFNLGPTSLEREFSSDTEEESWRNRLERGFFTEKVKEKSKSVTDLMILTHIESEESENDSLPSLSRQYAKKNAKITIFTGIGFSSEGNIRNALLREEFEEKLKSFNVWKDDSISGKTDKPESFLVNAASGTICKETVNKNIESEAAKQSSQEESVPKIVITESEFEENVEDEDQIEVRFEPRKFMFVCHESDSEDENCDKESSVILGSCEEHTLDFFKGLKTTYDCYEEAKILDEPKKEVKRFNQKVSKSKSLDSVLDRNNITEEVHFDSFCDSGHSSDRCIDQDKQMNDLKSRLEDVMKYGDDFQLRSSEDEYGGKLLTPDDERSSDSGFRDKGSLSESVEDTCDEKYNLEDIDAELDDYHVNEFESQSIESWFLHPKESKDGWGSISTENEEQTTLSIDAEFVAAIRNELSEKLPCAHQKTEEDTSPEETADPVFVYPSQLSPILEEESNPSSLIDDDSPLLVLPPPEIGYDTFKEDIIKEIMKSPDKDPVVVEDLEGGGEIILPEDKFMIEDDVLIIDTETNEVTLIESPKPQSHLAFVLPKRINENFQDDDSVNSETYILSPENAPTPDISYDDTLSSPENMSGLYMSPCSVRSDLFDSGPPSLPFDLGQSMEEVEEITPHNEAKEIMDDLINAGIVQPVILVEEETPNHKKAELEIDLMLQKPIKNDIVEEEEAKTSDQTWLKDLLYNEIKNEKLKPNLNSTLALLSPDVSDKNPSLGSSFASTPDDSKLILDSLSDSSNYSVIAAPTSLSIGSSVTVPMPSPEDADKGWRPTMCQLMELTDQAEGEEMTTSFIEPDENGVYTPDWESDTSESSSSGEFVWKEGVKDDMVVDTICLIQEPSKMERIDEEDENTTDTDDDIDSEGTEFIPSTWDPNATPLKSSLKSPTSQSSRKRVVFEKEKYQCVYKYPREPVEEDEPTPTPSTEYSTFNVVPDYDFTLEDWELGDGEMVPEESDDEEEKKVFKKREYDFYKLNYNLGTNSIMDDGEFFISGSSQGFDWGESDRSEFFPGRDIEEAEFAPEPVPINLGELRHTKDTLRLELPTLSRHVEKAEASFLDSGVDTASPDKRIETPDEN